jgi:hypothetical protein
VDEGGGLERVIGRLQGHPRRRQLPQLVIHERQQLRNGTAVSGRGGVQQERHLGHAGLFYPGGDTAQFKTGCLLLSWSFNPE